MLSLDEFKLVDLNDKDTFKRVYSKFSPPHSDYSFTTMVCWKDYMEYFYTIFDDSIIIMTKCDDKVQFRPPLGTPSLELYKQVMKLALEKGTNPPFGVICSEAKLRIDNYYPDLAFEPHRDFFDYVYLASDLAELQGKKYLKIRNKLNRFKKRFDYSVEFISKNNIEEVKEFLERWCLWKDCDKIPLLGYEKLAVEYCIEHYFELDISGVAIRIEGEIEAASIYETLNKETAVIHFEKAIPDFDGLYQAINQEVAKVLLKDFQYINREPDMGFHGLRLSKKKYKPHHMVEVYHLSQKELKKIIFSI